MQSDSDFREGGRVAEIEKLSDPEAWHYIDSTTNPTDEITRGKKVPQLAAKMESTANIGAFWPNHQPYFLLNRNLIGNFYCDIHSYVAHLICLFCTYANISTL